MKRQLLLEFDAFVWTDGERRTVAIVEVNIQRRESSLWVQLGRVAAGVSTHRRPTISIYYAPNKSGSLRWVWRNRHNLEWA